MEKAKFKIKGMYRQSGATLIEEKLKNLPGVIQAKISYESGKGVIVYDENAIEETKIQSEIESVGEYSVEKIEDAAQRKQATEDAIGQIKQRFGDGAIMRLGEAKRMIVECVPTGCLSLDIALGNGMPRGRIIEIFGPESSGKTTLALHVINEVQKLGGTAAFVDAEHALDPDYSKKIGVNINELLISQPDTGEQALEIVETLERSSAVDVIVIDSVAALVPKAEIEGDMGDSHMGLQARLMSHALRKLTGVISKTNTAVIFINQIQNFINIAAIIFCNHHKFITNSKIYIAVNIAV